MTRSADTEAGTIPLGWGGHALDTAAERLVETVRGEFGIALPLAFVLTDPAREDNPIVYVNDAFEAITGYPPEQALGRNCRFLQATDRSDPSRAELRRAIERQEPVTVDIPNRRRDGTTFTNRLIVSPLLGTKGDLLAYLGIQYEVGPAGA